MALRVLVLTLAISSIGWILSTGCGTAPGQVDDGEVDDLGDADGEALDDGGEAPSDDDQTHEGPDDSADDDAGNVPPPNTDHAT